MEAFRAPWVLPISTPPIADGIVVVDKDVIAGIGPAEDLLPTLDSTPITEFSHHALLPGLVNTHTHLALTREHGRHPQGHGLFEWLKSMMPAARDMTPGEQASSIREGLEQSFALGTALVGEILTGPPQLAVFLEDARLAKRVFLEVLSLNRERARETLESAVSAIQDASLPGHVQLGLSPHAPYSLHREVWTETVRAGQNRNIPWTSHIGETPGERNYIVEGAGEPDQFLEDLGIPRENRIPWGNPVVSVLEEMDALDGLLVHGVDLTVEEMDRLAVYDTPLCLCPGSNAWLGLPAPEVSELFGRGVFLCLGTDSSASNDSLSVWAEMRRVRKLAPEIPAEEILKMALTHGAIALKFNGLAGSLHPGSGSRILAVDLGTQECKDPLEFLVREPVEGHLTHVGIWGPDPGAHLVK